MKSMEDNPNMKMTVSLKKEVKQIFDELCDVETHGPTDQFRHILKHYLRTNNHYKPLLKRLEEEEKKVK